MRASFLALPALALLTAATGDTAFKIEPGTWSVRTDITDLQMPGAPPMLAKLMAKRPMKWKGCITPEMAAKGPPLGTFSRAGCTVTHKLSPDGVFSAHSVCPEKGGTLTVDTSGRHNGNSFTADGRSVRTGSGAMTMTMKMSGQRTGGC